MKHQHQQFTCPMHPEVLKDAPGKCHKCGMDLIPLKKGEKGISAGHQGHVHSGTIEKKSGHDHHAMGNSPMGHAGHDHHAMMIGDYKKRFWVSLIITIPILLLSEMIQHWLGFELNGYFSEVLPHQKVEIIKDL